VVAPPSPDASPGLLLLSDSSTAVTQHSLAKIQLINRARTNYQKTMIATTI